MPSTPTTQVMFSTTELSTLIGVRTYIVDEWCRIGVLSPSKKAAGKGDRRGFTLMETIGAVAGGAMYYSDRGCNIKYVGRVFEAFKATPEAWLLKAIKAGKVNLVDVSATSPYLERNDPSRPYLMNCVNVQAEYDRVVAAGS